MLEVHTFQVLELGIPELAPRFQICRFSGGRTPGPPAPRGTLLTPDYLVFKKKFACGAQKGPTFFSPAARKKAQNRKKAQKGPQIFFSPAARKKAQKIFACGAQIFARELFIAFLGHYFSRPWKFGNFEKVSRGGDRFSETFLWKFFRGVTDFHPKISRK